MSDVPHAQALAVLAGPKFCDTQLSWAERVNHSGHLLATAALEDDTGAILPGLTLQLEVKRPIVADRCLYELGLFLLQNGVRRRIYQLNVCPPDKRSHNGAAGTLHGPHEHVGDHTAAVTDPTVRCGALGVAFAVFCRRVNLSFSGALNPPL